MSLAAWCQTLGRAALVVCAIVLAGPAFAAGPDPAARKLADAQAFVVRFLSEDSRADQVFFHRDPSFPAARDQPLNDCATRSFVRAIEQRGEPKFEGKRQKYVLVPVVAELVMVFASRDGGPSVKPGVEQYSWCSFEYERYDAARREFVSIPGFRSREHNVEFATWGPSLDEWRAVPLPAGLVPNRFVAVSPQHRYVRFWVRVNVSQQNPHRSWPQTPRHWYAKDAIAKLERISREEEAALAAGVSTMDSRLRGQELQDDLERMRQQRREYLWKVEKMKAALATISGEAPFAGLP